MGGELDEGEIGARVLEDHRFVDHGQLEMGVRIVDRYPSRFSDRHDGERGERQKAFG